MRREEDGLYADGSARTTVSFRQPAHVIKFPDDEDENDNGERSAFYVRQNGKTPMRANDSVDVFIVVGGAETYYNN